MDSLVIPEQLAIVSIQGDHAIGKKVVTRTVDAIKIIGRRTGGDEYHSSSGIDYRSRPCIRASHELFTGITRPSLRPGLAIRGNCVKRPPQFAGVHIEGPLIPWRGWRTFGHSCPDD